MKPGNLVRITRPSIGIPKNTLALVVDIKQAGVGLDSDMRYYIVQAIGLARFGKRRYLDRDLEIIT